MQGLGANQAEPAESGIDLSVDDTWKTCPSCGSDETCKAADESWFCEHCGFKAARTADVDDDTWRLSFMTAITLADMAVVRGNLGTDVAVDVHSLAERISSARKFAHDNGHPFGVLPTHDLDLTDSVLFEVVGGGSGHMVRIWNKSLKQATMSLVCLHVVATSQTFDGGIITDDAFEVVVGGQTFTLKVLMVLPALDVAVVDVAVVDVSSDVDKFIGAFLSAPETTVCAHTVDVDENAGEHVVFVSRDDKKPFEEGDSGIAVLVNGENHILVGRLATNRQVGVVCRRTVCHPLGALLQKPDLIQDGVFDAAQFQPGADEYSFGDFFCAIKSVMHVLSFAHLELLGKPLFHEEVAAWLGANTEGGSLRDVVTYAALALGATAHGARVEPNGFVGLPTTYRETLLWLEQKEFTTGNAREGDANEFDGHFFQTCVESICEGCSIDDLRGQKRGTPGQKALRREAISKAARCLMPFFWGTREADGSCCWNMPRVGARGWTECPSWIAQAFTQVGSVVAKTRFKQTENNMTREDNKVVLFVNSEIPLCCADWSEGNLILHQPLLCEFGRGKGENPSHVCARPCHLTQGSHQVNSIHRKQYQEAGERFCESREKKDIVEWFKDHEVELTARQQFAEELNGRQLSAGTD